MASNELPRAAFSRAPVDRTDPTLIEGGLALLLLGTGEDAPEKYALHGQVKCIMGSNIKGGRDLDVHIPANTKVVLFQGKLADKRVFLGVHEVLRRRRLPYIMRDNQTAIESALDDLFRVSKTHTPKPAAPKVTLGDAAAEPLAAVKRHVVAKGALRAFLDQHAPAILKDEPTVTNAGAARKLLPIAQDAGLSTTVHSLEQAFRLWRRDHRYTERPASLQTDEQKTIGGVEEAIELTQQALKRLEAIKDLYLGQREELQALEKENKTLKKKLAKAKEVFDAFRGDIETEDE